MNAQPAHSHLDLAASPSGARPRTLRSPSAVGAVHGVPRVLLRVESGLLLVGALAAYAHLGGSWLWFAVLFLAPDLSLLGYVRGPRIGAAAYNAAHGFVGPALLAAVALATDARTLLLGAVIWTAHVGFDRLVGYGLKYGTSFADTHLGSVGPVRR